ncbi:MAG: hypothetical protein EOO13_10110 [Chitinophagaceae bacterium]|nr:MAG: hypothetical protein EOO13_10110 [Chitinophagaceae bacterium]
MKAIPILLLSMLICTAIFSQGITLLYRGPSGWDDANSWIQLNAPIGQTPISRIPLSVDDVVFSRSMSGVTTFALSGDHSIGAGAGSICRSMQVRDMLFYFENQAAFDRAANISIYTTNGGYFIADSAANIKRGNFFLYGGQPAITDLQIINSTYGDLFTHANWSSIEILNNSRARFKNSHLEGNYFVNNSPAALLYADNSEFVTPSFTMGANTTDSLFNSTIRTGNNYVTLDFTIGPGANFVSSNLTVRSLASLKFITSGSVFNGDVSIEYPGYLYLDQINPASPLANIINGNLTTGETYGIYLKGDLKISGNLILNTVAEALNNDTATVIVTGQPIFVAGGISYLNNNPSRIEFFGNGNSNIIWPLGFPIDTLILNKTGCGKLTINNSLYVVGKTKILQGQLQLNPNAGIPFKLVCLGDLEVMPGAGLFLRKNNQNIVAAMAIQGDIIDQNAVADSTCNGISNPYGGNITLYRNANNVGNNVISVNHPQGLPNLHLAGRQGAGYTLANNLSVYGTFTLQSGELNLNNYQLTVKP